MKARRLDYSTRDNASKGHRQLLALLRSMFPNHLLYQEYPYNKILLRAYQNSEIPDEIRDSYLLRRGGNLHADIYDRTLNIIYEVQGEHHFRPVARDKTVSDQQVILGFEAQKRNDKLKRRIANEAKTRLVEIPYTDLKNLNEHYVWERLEAEL